MSEEKKQVTFALTNGEKAFYDAGHIAGQIAAREEVSKYLINFVTLLSNGMKDTDEGDGIAIEDVIRGVSALSSSLQENAQQSKKLLSSAIRNAVENDRFYNKIERMVSFAFDGAMRGWRGK